NAGIVATARPIVAGAPLAYYSSLPLDAMLAALRGVNVPSAITNHAGTFVCNHVYYSAQHEVEQAGLPTRCGFLHLPALVTAEKPGGLPLATMIDAVERCLRAAGA